MPYPPTIPPSGTEAPLASLSAWILQNVVACGLGHRLLSDEPILDTRPPPTTPSPPSLFGKPVGGGLNRRRYHSNGADNQRNVWRRGRLEGGEGTCTFETRDTQAPPPRAASSLWTEMRSVPRFGGRDAPHPAGNDCEGQRKDGED